MKAGQTIMALGVTVFICGGMLRRLVSRDDIPNGAYFVIYATAIAVIGIGYAVKKGSGS